MKQFYMIVNLAIIAIVLVLESSLTRAQPAMSFQHPDRLKLIGVRIKQEQDSLAKVGSDLASLWIEYQAHARVADPRTFQPKNSLLPVYDGRVLIDAVAASDARTLLTDLEGLGLQNGSTYGRVVSGLLPIESIDEMASLTSLQFARPAYRRTR